MPLELQFDRDIPANALAAFTQACHLVIDKYRAFGIPLHWLNGSISFEWRKPGNAANGQYDQPRNIVRVLLPQIKRTVVDVPWVITHELAHRIYYRALSVTARAEWTRFVSRLGTPFQPEAIKVSVSSARHNARNPYWFWFRQNFGSDYQGFAAYLSQAKTSTGLPRIYSNVSPDEAFADVVSDLVLGRSHGSTLMRRTGTQARILVLRLLRTGYMSEEKRDAYDYASTQIDLPEIKDDLDTWVKKNIKQEWLDPEHGVEDDPHVTALHGLLSENPGPLKNIAKNFGKVTLSIGALDYFERPEFDVLYASVESRDLHKLHKAIKKLPNKEEFSTYTPHITIAYLKKGLAKQFKGLKPIKAVLTKKGFMLCSRKGTKEFIPTEERGNLFGDMPRRKAL